MSDEKTDLDEEEYMQKRVARYQVLWTAWAENSIEVDKQFLTLSTAAIGLLVFIHNKLNNDIEKILWLFAGGFFIATIIIILRIFYLNKKYIGHVLNESDEHDAEKEEEKLNNKLKKLGIASLFTFGLGVFLTFLMMFFKLSIWAVILHFYQCFLDYILVL